MRLMTGVAVVLAAMTWVASPIGVPTAEGQVMGLGAPMTVRFVGTFTPWEKDKAPGAESLTVTVGPKRFFFRVTQVQSYDGSDPSMMLLQHIFPPELEFLGPKHRLQLLEDSKPGRLYAVEGWLYAGDNMFYVAAVKPLAG